MGQGQDETNILVHQNPETIVRDLRIANQILNEFFEKMIVNAGIKKYNKGDYQAAFSFLNVYPNNPKAKEYLVKLEDKYKL